jgi:hypothetical protein
MPREKKINSPTIPSEQARDDARAKQVLERRKRRGLNAGFDWNSASAAAIHRVVCAVTSAGFTCQFGIGRDGNSGVIRTWHPNVKLDDIYIRPTEDVELALEAIAIDFGANI